MNIIKKQKLVDYEIYQTIDGKEFTNIIEAQIHEDKIKGTKKTCDLCNGSGEINGRYVTEYHNTSMIPTQCEEVCVWKKDVCTKCKGKGYLELKYS